MTNSAFETRPAAGLSKEQIDVFNRDGFTIVSGALPTSRIRESRERLATIFEAPLEPAHGDFGGVRSNIIARHEWLSDLLFSEPVLAALRSLLGERIVMLPETSVTDSQFGGWHTDTTSAELAGETFRTDPDFRILNAAIYFQENGRFGGGLDVVPGSHLKPDLFLEKVQKQYETHEKSKVSRGIQAKLYTLLSAVLPKALFEFRRKHLKKSAQPLQAESREPGQVTIGQRPGDLVMFDLRLSHKATWPEVPPPYPAEARKFSFFAICGADNETTRRYCRYLKKRSLTQPAYAYLINHRYPDSLLEKARSVGVTLI